MACNDLMHVPVLDVRILRNEIMFPYESQAMKSLDVVIVKSLVSGGPIVLMMKWPDGGYTRTPPVVGISEVPHLLLIQASQSFINNVPHRIAETTLNPRFGDSREGCCFFL
jgi:hypothetical protein